MLKDTDYKTLQENKATNAQILKAKEVCKKLFDSKYTEYKLWCYSGHVRIYIDSGFINIDRHGSIAINCKQKFMHNKINYILGNNYGI